MAKRTSPFEPDADTRIICLHGRERFLARQYTSHIVEALTEVFGEIEQFQFDGGEVDLAVLLDELRSYGLLQPHKLVILDRADVFFAGAVGESRREAMERYLDAQVDHATLLMRADTWRFPRLRKKIEAAGTFYAIPPVNEASAIGWCRRRCEKQHDTTIESDAATALVDRIGPDLDRLDAELGKLASFVGAGRPVTMAEVGQLIGLSREQEAWTIQSAMGSGHPARALATLRELLEISRQPEALVSWAIMDLLRKVHAASRLLAEGRSPAVVAKELRLWPAEAKSMILALAGRLDPEAVAQLLRDAVEADWRTKRGFGRGPRTLEALVVAVADSMSACAPKRAG